MIFLRSFNFHWPDTNGFGHLDFLFCEVPVKVFCVYFSVGLSFFMDEFFIC